MHASIRRELSEIEQRENVKVLYACVSGSRAWGFPSKNSDYDVRFIYLHPTDWYLSIFERPDIIERPISDVLDISGWDLRKTLQLLRKSNPSLLEWLQSPIIYQEKHAVIQQLRDLARVSFSPKACIYHYLNMAKRNQRILLQGEQVGVKQYINVLRPMLAAQWIDRYHTMPPVEFERLVEAVVPKGKLRDEIQMLIAQKKACEVRGLVLRITNVDDFIHYLLESLEEQAKVIAPTIVKEDSKLDQFFCDTLKDIWG